MTMMMSIYFCIFIMLLVNHCCASIGEKKTDTLIVMIDTIDLRGQHIDSASGYAIAINYAYAEHKGYDFVYCYVDRSMVLEKGYRSMGLAFSPPIQNSRDKAHSSKHEMDVGTFHPGLAQYRAVPWIKLPVLWNISKYGVNNKKYGKIFYLSTQSVINAAFQEVSIADKLDEWSRNDAVVRGASPRSAAVIYLSNFPYFPRPFTDAFYINTKYDAASDLFMHLWNCDASSKNFNAFFDRAVLWRSLEARKRYSKSTSYVHSERQFPPCERHWLCSMPNFYAKDRLNVYRRMAVDVLKMGDVNVALNQIRSENVINVDMSSIVEDMWSQNQQIWFYSGNPANWTTTKRSPPLSSSLESTSTGLVPYTTDRGTNGLNQMSVNQSLKRIKYNAHVLNSSTGFKNAVKLNKYNIKEAVLLEANEEISELKLNGPSDQFLPVFGANVNYADLTISEKPRNAKPATDKPTLNTFSDRVNYLADAVRYALFG